MEKLCLDCNKTINKKAIRCRSCAIIHVWNTTDIRKRVKEKLTKNFETEKICPICLISFKTKNPRKRTCSVKCGYVLGWGSEDSKLKVANKVRNRCKSLEERKRLRDIGRFGGYGEKGFTKEGSRYESRFEKQVFEFLEDKNIKFEAHKHIPNSSKVCDVYLIDSDIWIELDGIDRESKKKYSSIGYKYWIIKLGIYKQLKLNYKIFKNFCEFAEFFNSYLATPEDERICNTSLSASSSPS